MRREVARRREVTARRAAGERGSGTVVTLGAALGLLAVLLMLLPLAVVLASRQSVTGAADAAALAGADVASGLLPGYPCQEAARVAAANGAELAACAVDGLVVTVTASRSLLALTIAESATAGPAGSAPD